MEALMAFDDAILNRAKKLTRLFNNNNKLICQSPNNIFDPNGRNSLSLAS